MQVLSAIEVMLLLELRSNDMKQEADITKAHSSQQQQIRGLIS